MTRSRLLTIAFILAIVGVSFLAPAPVTRDVEANQSQACPGLQRAYQACRTNDGSGNGCSHIREQLFAHGCYSGSGSGGWSDGPGPISGSGGGSY